MTPLVEVNNVDELEIALAADARYASDSIIIGTRGVYSIILMV
jgi:hypothetical protein